MAPESAPDNFPPPHFFRGGLILAVLQNLLPARFIRWRNDLSYAAIRKGALYNVAMQLLYCGVSYGIALYVCCILTLIHFPFASALQEAEYGLLAYANPRTLLAASATLYKATFLMAT